MGEIIDGKKVAKETREEIAKSVEELKHATGVVPGLAAVLVGDNAASQIYVRNKRKACSGAGIYSEEHTLPAETTEAELLSLIKRLNNDNKIHGILVQLPLPGHINESAILRSVSPLKDVDGFHPENVGLLVQGHPRFVPCTPNGIMRMLDAYNVEIEGARAVVIGRSNIVGKPVALMLLERHSTVTLCHSRTLDLAAEVGEFKSFEELRERLRDDLRTGAEQRSREAHSAALLAAVLDGATISFPTWWRRSRATPSTRRTPWRR